jgi:predicted nucleotidyltransferase component of viral defense system
MERESLKETGEHVYNRIRAASKKAGLDAQFAFQKFALERFLVRLAEACLSEQFALKGGMLMLTLPGGMLRPTEDMDLTADHEITVESFRETLALVCASAPLQEDGLTFSLQDAKLSSMRVDAVNPTIRAALTAELHTKSRGPKLRIKLDVSHSDHIYPALTSTQLPETCTGFIPPVVPCYPWPTVAAEKISAIHQHGMANTRMRDYYDLIAISRYAGLSADDLGDAVHAVFAARGREVEAFPVGLSPAFAKLRAREWKALVTDLKLTGAPDSFDAAIDLVADFVIPALEVALMRGSGGPSAPRP